MDGDFFVEEEHRLFDAVRSLVRDGAFAEDPDLVLFLERSLALLDSVARDGLETVLRNGDMSRATMIQEVLALVRGLGPHAHDSQNRAPRGLQTAYLTLLLCPLLEVLRCLEESSSTWLLESLRVHYRNSSLLFFQEMEGVQGVGDQGQRETLCRFTYHALVRYSLTQEPPEPWVLLRLQGLQAILGFSGDQAGRRYPRVTLPGLPVGTPAPSFLEEKMALYHWERTLGHRPTGRLASRFDRTRDPQALRLAVVANCQVQPIAYFLGLNRDVEGVDQVPVHFWGNEALFSPYEKRFRSKGESGYDLILTFNLGEEYKDFSTGHLRASSLPVVRLTNFYFSGLHPDITYLGSRGKRLESPLGDYHSRIVLKSFLRGETRKECLSRFQLRTYQEEDYFAAYAASERELLARDSMVDIPFAQEFLALVRSSPCLYSVNHPSGAVFSAYADKIFRSLGMEPSALPPGLVPNHLATSGWWPVYPEIAGHHGLSYPGSYVFRQPDDKGGKILSLEEFIEGSYSLYEQDRRAVEGTPFALDFLSGKSKPAPSLKTPKTEWEGPPGDRVFLLGFDPDKPFSFEEAGSPVINLGFSLEGPLETSLTPWLEGLKGFAERFPSNAVVNLSFQPLGNRMEAEVRNGRKWGVQGYRQVQERIKHLVWKSREKGWLTRDHWSGGNMVMDGWDRKLYTRFGNVELRVLENYLTDPQGLFAVAEDFRRHLDDPSRFVDRRTGSNWLSAEEIPFNLTQLQTYAGFYFSRKADGPDDSLPRWCRLYLQALAASDFLFEYPGAAPNYWVVQEHLFQQEGRLPRAMEFPSLERFYRSLAGRKILFITPLARKIQENFDQGKLFKLYKSIPIPRFQLTTLPCEVSIYPNRPDSCWSESYDRLVSKVDSTMAAGNFDLVFATSGCYGLPLSHHVHRTYGCATAYYGNFMNTLFGVLSGSSKDFMVEERLAENWVVSDLGKYPGVEKIDGGRYV